jgi:hypothetical protein
MYLGGRRLLAITLAESRGNFIGLIKVLVADEIQLVSKLGTTGKNCNWLLPTVITDDTTTDIYPEASSSAS